MVRPRADVDVLTQRGIELVVDELASVSEAELVAMRLLLGDDWIAIFKDD